MPRANPATQTRVAPVAPMATGEIHSGDHDHQDVPSIVMPGLGESISDDLRENTQEALGAHAANDYLTELQFMEQPVSIRIEPGQEENAPLTVECYVNGKGAEVFLNNRWQEMGFLPVGVVVVTKRKYVEVLARSRTMKCSTLDHSDLNNVDKNEVRRRNVRLHSFSVVHDPSPRGVAWLTQIFNELF